MAAGIGGRWLINAAERQQKRSALVWLAILIVMLAPLLAFADNFAVNDRHRYFLATDYVRNIESTIAPDGLLLTSDWQVYSPQLYLREIENQRRDIKAIDIHLLRRSWYFDYLETQYPELMDQNRAEVSAFLDDLRAWENDPARYERDPELTERINSRFYKMIEAFIRSHSKSAPVYATLDVALDKGQDAELARWIGSNYQLVPQGLVFQLSEARSFVQPVEINLVTRGLHDGTVRFEPDDVVAQKVLPAYVNMLYNRGMYLKTTGRYEEAAQSFQQALTLDPDNGVVRQGLSDSERMQPRSR
jgi:tetratricopeptide (TPR) repeat protein